MTQREKKFLLDILRAIELIETFISDTNSFEEYKADLKTKSAVERQLAIIGEAINSLYKEPNHLNLNQAIQIISLRNRLVHTYDNVDDTIIWAILKLHIQPLKNEVIHLLSSQ